jgi:hypothetical protein
MIETYKELAIWHQIIWSVDKPMPHLLFLRLKPKWKAFDEVWFMSTPIGCNQLCFTINKLTSNFLDLCEKVLSNRTGQGVGITRMEEAFALQEYGMEVIGHRDLISYGKLVCKLFSCFKIQFLVWFFVFELYKFFLKLWFASFVGIIILTNTYVKELCNELSLVSLDVVVYCILRRLLTRKRLPMTRLRYEN